MSDEMVTVYWLCEHDEFRVGTTVEISKSRLIDGMPAPRCPQPSWVEPVAEPHRMRLATAEEYHEIMDDDE